MGEGPCAAEGGCEVERVGVDRVAAWARAAAGPVRQRSAVAAKVQAAAVELGRISPARVGKGLGVVAPAVVGAVAALGAAALPAAAVAAPQVAAGALQAAPAAPVAHHHARRRHRAARGRCA